MAEVFLRCGRRRTAWEPGVEAEELYGAEFKNRRTGEPDLCPSVYFVENKRDLIIRVHAEHAASIPLNPPRASVNLDLSGWSKYTDSEGACSFEFARRCHRELLFSSKSALMEFLSLVATEITSRSYVTRGKELLGYARSKIGSSDEEWVRFCESGKGENWGC